MQVQRKLFVLIFAVSLNAMVIGGMPNAKQQSRVRIWQDGVYLLIQRSGGHATLPAPGPYNGYPDYRILSRSGKVLAFPVFTKDAWELDWINLATKELSTLERGKDAYYARVSASDRYLSALVNAVYTVYDLTTGVQRVLDRGIHSVVWSRRGDFLFFRKANKTIGAFDARANKLFDPSPSLVDREVGRAYRMYVPELKVTPPAEVSPSGEFAFMDALKGGFVAIPIDGRYHGQFGMIEPFTYGVMDSRGKVRTFVAPEAYRREDLSPIGWTRSDALVLRVGTFRDELLEYNPKSGRVVLRKLKPPTEGADLIAMADYGI